MIHLNKTLFVIIFLMVIQANAQIGIGKEILSNESVLLEFGTDSKGILLPSVQSVAEASPGTFIFNTVVQSVQVLEGTEWKNLTNENQAIVHSFSNTGTDVGEGVIIGAETSSKKGVLILESTTQAMVLPQVFEPHLNINGAIAGTIVYDTSCDMLAVYDGVNWSYWK